MKQINYDQDEFYFEPIDLSLKTEYQNGFKIPDIFTFNIGGIMTSADQIYYDKKEQNIKSRIEIIPNDPRTNDIILEELKNKKFNLN